MQPENDAIHLVTSPRGSYFLPPNKVQDVNAHSPKFLQEQFASYESPKAAVMSPPHPVHRAVNNDILQGSRAAV